MKHTQRLTLILLLASAVGASAQTMKPGLWEVNSKMGGNPQMEQAMAQMQKQMAAMTPAQRKQMEAAMGKNGVSFSGSAGGGMVSKACISKEMIDRGQLATQQNGNCTTTLSEKTSNSMKMKFVCTQPPSSGEGVYTFSGDTAYTMKMTLMGTPKAQTSNTTIEASGKWLGSDCGAIKPIVMPK
jgi:hypothetical protein